MHIRQNMKPRLFLVPVFDAVSSFTAKSGIGDVKKR